MLTNDQKKALSRVVGFDVFNTPDELLEIFRSTANEELSKTDKCDVCNKYIFRATNKKYHSEGDDIFCSEKCREIKKYMRKGGYHRKHIIPPGSGGELRKRRVALKLSTPYIARILNCTPVAIRAIEQGLVKTDGNSEIAKLYIAFLDEREGGDDVRND